jgi:hypothetical protein
MIIPKFWSESKVSVNVTLTRLGWSDVSEKDAEQHANLRLDEAITTLKATGEIRAFDHSVAYNGGEGIPIREEVVATHDEVLISRNGYGALCLNTPNVLFADVDVNREEPDPIIGTCIVTFIFLAGGLFISFYESSIYPFLMGAIVSFIVGKGAEHRYKKPREPEKMTSPEYTVFTEFEKISKKYPDLNLRVYKTYKGFRVLVMNRTFDPRSNEAQSLLQLLSSDDTYNK